MKKENDVAITGVQLLHNVWPLNVFKRQSFDLGKVFLKILLLIGRRQTELQKEQQGEWTRVLHLFHCSQDSMNSGGQNLRNVAAIYAMSKISYHMGKLRNNGVLKINSVSQSYYSEHKVGYHPISAKDQVMLHQFGRKVSPLRLAALCMREEAVKETNSVQTLKNYRRKTEVLCRKKETIFTFSNGTAKLAGKGSETWPSNRERQDS